MLTLRTAEPADCEAFAEIYRHYVETSVATFDHDAPDVDEWRAKLAATLDAGRPFLAAEDPDIMPGVIGYAYLGPYRGKAGWGWTAEDSIYLRPEASGRGHGSALLAALVEATDTSVVRTIMAVISDEVPASIRLHERAGFAEVGRSAGVGYKFDRWLGCVYMQLSLVAGDTQA
ncbi:N-acetyltransferase family protein [Gordonia malaquae]|uniref:GNAT family N-acetyltransferase n=1 Tax=Gordonia malaquae TaxID=410332 RepID=UPI0030FEE29E